MSVETLRPDDTLASDFASVTGAASLHAALADDSDSSYGDSNPNPGASQAVLEMEQPTPPAGSVLKEVRLRLRGALGLIGGTVYGVRVAGKQLSPYSGAFLTATTWEIGRVALSDLSDPLTVQLSARSYDPGGSARLYELFLDAVYVEQPVVSADAPTGTLEDTNLPLVEWSNTLDAEGGIQTNYEVKVFTPDQYGAGGFDPDTSEPYTGSGVKAGAVQSWRVEESIEDDENVRFYVRVAQTVNGERHWSDWDYAEADIDVPNPGVPTISADGDGEDARIAIDLDDTAGDLPTDLIQVQRSLDAGQTWENIRTELGGGRIEPSTEGPTLAYDYEVPNGEEAIYRARAIYEDPTGERSVSDWSDPVSASWESDHFWLKHPTKPSLNTAINLASPATQGIARAARQGTFQPLGATKATVVTDTRMSPTGSVRFRCDTDEDRDALRELLDTLSPLLLQHRPDDHEPDRWVALGDHQHERWIDKSWVEGTWQELPWVEVAAPEDNLEVVEPEEEESS